jgi:Xaa-Pro aminopeptidase
MRRAYLRDGVCWVKWAAWLDELIRVKKETIDEKAASDALIEIRKKAERYAGMESYDAISASGENAGENKWVTKRASVGEDENIAHLDFPRQLYRTTKHRKKDRESLTARHHT